MSQTESGWSEVVGEKPEADSRDANYYGSKTLRQSGRDGAKHRLNVRLGLSLVTDSISVEGNAIASVRPSFVSTLSSEPTGR